ncbi:MAG TPA: DUF3365 domain-containing protein [Chromatiales bacterium]|nr:DUF3365 domain-containing protein [Chromatiales bacterium]
MRRALGVVLAALLGAAPVAMAAAGAGDPERRAAESRKVVRAFMQALKKELKGAMEKGGPVRAIAVCRERAPAIAQRFSKETGWEVGRTSLRYRNPANAPDAWERRVLESFEARRRAGEPAARLEHYEVTPRDGRRVFRYMKAIPTGPVCLACHGERLAPEVARALDRHYPGDRARGFRVGDIRGAFTIVQPLD